MATDSSFRFWRPGINFRAKFESQSETDELEDMLRSIELGQRQQHALLTSPSWHSESIHSRESTTSHIRRVPDLIRQRSKRLRPSWLSAVQSGDTGTTEGPLELEQDATCASASSSISSTSQHSHLNTEQIAVLYPPPGMPCQHDLVRSPAQREVPLAMKVRRLKKEQKKLQKKLVADPHADLQRRISLQQGQQVYSPNVSDESQLSAHTSLDPHGSSSGNRPTWRRSLLKIGGLTKRRRQVIPMPSDFDSKSELRAYLNPVEDILPIPQIPELPAESPPKYYRDDDGMVPKLGEPSLFTEPVVEAPISTTNHQADPPQSTYRVPIGSRRMKCDACHSPIRVSEHYYQCNKCNEGDRIICSACSYNGELCRHNLSWRIHSVKHVDLDTGLTPSSEAEAIATRNATLGCYDRILLLDSDIQTAKQSTTRPDVQVCSPNDIEHNPEKVSLDGFEAFQKLEHLYRHNEKDSHVEVTKKIEERDPQQSSDRKLEKSLKRREADLKQREHVLVIREKECTLRGRELDLQERENDLDEREAALNKQDVSSLSKPPLSPSALSGTTMLDASSLATHDSLEMLADRVQEDTSESGNLPDQVSSEIHAAEQYKQEVHTESLPGIRSHANSGKRKSRTSQTDTTASSPQTSESLSRNSSKNDKRYNNDGNDDDEEPSADEGEPKRRKPSSPLPNGPQRLLACPYAKWNPARYTERNQLEKQYRSCSGKYLTDVSRLKQHLYRVHKRPEHHCARCYAIFASQEDLDVHSRQDEPCAISECSFVEKFTEDKMKQLKKKRPGKSVEQSWYIIFGILFPDAPPPDSPWIDDHILSSPTSLVNEDHADPRTANLLEIFNQQLSHHQDVASHAWLASREARDLLNATLALSMTEMLRRISPTNTPSFDRTPSIYVSPDSVHPPSNSTMQTPSSSLPPSPSTPKLPSTRKILPVRDLSPLHALQVDLERQLRHGGGVESKSTYSNPTSATVAHINHDTTAWQTQAWPIGSDDIELPDIEDCDKYMDDDPDYGLRFGLGIGEAISTDNNMFDFGFGLPATEADSTTTKFEHRLEFRAVSLSSLQNISLATDISGLDVKPFDINNSADSTAANGNTARLTTTKMNGNSMRSVDSGYASNPHSRQNSRRENNNSNNIVT